MKIATEKVNNKIKETEESYTVKVVNIPVIADNDDESIETDSTITEEVIIDDSVQDHHESCENCNKIFTYNNDMCEDMCDECIVIIADRESIRLPNSYHCDVC